MGNLDRIRLLLQFTEEEPENPFNWYALALEYSENEPTKARNLFDKLLKDHESYLPTYYPAAHLFAGLNELEIAQTTFEKGLEIARLQQETKTLRELQNAYQNFLFEYDLD